MMAYPNIDITNEIIQYLLLVIYNITTYRIKHLPDSCQTGSQLQYDTYNYNDIYINSLIIAGEYGDFKGDVILMNRFINSKSRVIIPISFFS